MINVREMVESELLNDEELIWYDQPIAKKITGEGIILSVFGIFFTAVSGTGLWTLIKPSSPFDFNFHHKTTMEKLFPLFILPFFIIGLALLAGPYWVYKSALKTIYVLTDKRCIIIKAGRTKKVSSYDVDEINNIEKKEYSDGSGTLVFLKETYLSSRDDNGHRSVRTKNIGFLEIRDVKKVELKLRNVLK